MNKILVYISENKKFSLADTALAIKHIPGTSNIKMGDFIGAKFECEYTSFGETTIVRISPELETITIEGVRYVSLDFALKLQLAVPIPLHAIDINYNFDIALSDFKTVQELADKVLS